MRYFRLQNILDYSAYLIVRMFVCVVQALPVDTCAAIARWLAMVCCDVLKIRRSVVEENIGYAYPEMSPAERQDLARRMWEHLFLMVIEVIHAPRKIHQTNWREYVSLHNAHLMIEAFFDDRPSIIICGHFGNFELSGVILGMLGFPSHTVARPLDNVYLDRYLNAFRETSGQYILPKVGSSPALEAVLAKGGIIALLGDQHAGPKGCWVDFFGRPASSHKAIALFTLQSEAPTLFCYAMRTDRPLSILLSMPGQLEPRTMPAEMRSVPAITEWYTRHLETTIRRAPEQYWWLHRRWRDNRPVKKSPPPSQADAVSSEKTTGDLPPARERAA